ncbi:flagellar biosynthetic protein FliR [Candidatus Kryptonium thompsonii]|uniref:flagellar biosynthetic protein FliR n=1 Tax=Candidatus Kryptonium thompsonii TaxID=1633631 RepID=UPI00094CCAAC|nr:flagellar biosynthetic protein FliR [Candidatus Kryptonium thompsoni]
MFFASAVKISAPALIALFLTDLSIGILSRAFPQMNIFMFAFSFKVIVGIIALILMMPFFVFVFKNLLFEFEKDLLELLKVIGA